MKNQISNTTNYFDILLIFFGWLLGLFSNILFEMYKKYGRKRGVKKGIMNELEEFRLRLAAINFEQTLEGKAITLEYAKWIKPYYRKLFETDTYDYLRNVPKIDKPITNLSDKEFLDCLLISQNRIPKSIYTTTPTIPKFKLAYLESKYDSISLFKESVALNISQLKREIDNLNDSIDDVKYYHNKTFESHSDANRQVIDLNIKNNINKITKATKFIIKLVEKIMKQISA